MNFQHSNINGIHIATAEMPHMESVSAGIFIPTGSRYETEELNGIAHFAEHMIFKGTNNHSALDLAIQIEGAGGTINAFTTEDQTCIETRGPANQLPRYIEIMSEMIWNSVFDSEEIEREREVIAEEIVMYQENPSDHIHDLLSEALWTNHPLGRPITGTEKSIQKITAKELQNFTEQQYLTKGLTLAVAGKISHQDVCKIAEIHLPKTNIKTNTTNQFEPYPNPSSIPLNTSHIHEQRDIDQIHLAIAFHTDGRHSENRHVLRLMSLILGETMSSRLFQELREKRGLCYHVASDYSLYHDTGTFEIHAGLDATRLKDSLQIINQLIQEILKNGFTKAELEQTLSYATGQSQIALESTHSRMSWMGDSLLCFNKIIDPKDSESTLKSTTLQQLNNLAQQLFSTDNLAIATIGPQTTEEVYQIITNTITC